MTPAEGGVLREGGVLIVDDDYGMRDTLTEVLRDAGYQVAGAGDGAEALTYLRAHPSPCLILLDWKMPRCDADQFREAQLADPAIATVPVVLLAGDTLGQEKRNQFRAEEYLAKPVRLQRLLEVVSRFCRC